MRSDPTDTGGLFVGRRPGTAPLKYRDVPERAGTRRQRTDGLLAHAVLVFETLLVLTCWGPQPVGALWVGSQVSFHSGSLFFGIVVAFGALLASVFATLWVAVRVDGAWRLLRRAAGHDQKEGVLGRVFMWTAVVCGGAFLFWLIVINGPGSTLAPARS